MPISPALKLNIPIPAGGIVIDKPAEFIDARSISNCQNIEIYRSSVRKRSGGDALGTSLGERIMGMAELDNGTDTFFVRVGLTKAQVINKSTLAWTDIHNTALGGSGEEIVSFAFPLISAAKYMVYTNLANNIRKYNGSGNDADLGGSPPRCRFILDFNDYLILAYIIDSGSTFGYRVQWCDTGDPETWSGGNAGSTNLLEDSLDITGLSRFGDFIAVHKESAIYLGQKVNTSEVFRFTRKETGSGAIAGGSIQNLPDGTQIFLARDGLRLFNGLTTTLVPSSIVEELRDSVNPQYVRIAVSTLVRELDEYWIGIPTGNQTEPETVYKYNYRTGQVYKDARSGLTALALYRRTDETSWDDDDESWDSDPSSWDSITELALHKAVVTGDDSGNVLIRSTNTDDDATAIDSIWDTKDFTATDLGEEYSYGTMVRWKGLDVWAKGTDVSVYYSTDSGTTWTLIGSLDLDSDYPGDDSPDILYFDVISSKIRFRFRNNRTDESWTLKQYTIQYSVREKRK